MIAEFDAALAEGGPAAYRRLFWEAGAVGQALYLEAEAAGLRGTGIGCFFDDGVHQLLGITGHALQSLYHFTVGGPSTTPASPPSPATPGTRADAVCSRPAPGVPATCHRHSVSARIPNPESRVPSESVSPFSG